MRSDDTAAEGARTGSGNGAILAATAAINVAWCVAGLILGFLYTAIDFPFLPFAAFLCFVWASTGVCVFALTAWRAARLASKTASVAMAFVVPVTATCFVMFWPSLVSTGDELRMRWEFERLEPQFRIIVDQLKKSAPLKGGRHMYQSTPYIVEPGPPLRVAFPRPGGILDNWCGIVYDPSGEVLKARQFKSDYSNWDDPSLQHVKQLFGGDLKYSVHLRGHFYRCWFT
jgi:hypothetical protein